MWMMLEQYGYQIIKQQVNEQSMFIITAFVKEYQEEGKRLINH